MKTILLILALAVGVSAQTLQTDKFSDRSWYTSKRVKVYSAKSGLLVYNPGQVTMTAMSSATASLGGADRAYSVLFEVDSSNWQFAGRECVIWTIADGNRRQFGCKVIRNHAFRGGDVTEGLTMRLTADEFKTLFTAKELELRVGIYEFTVKEKHLKELRKVLL
ncbi:MAG: hypothetical protein ACR2HX_16740 [Pyrinomonadaceae bacterium]